MLDLLIVAPYLSLIPAFLFAYFYVQTKQKFQATVSILWVLYTLYEFGMKLRIFCDGECNIRVDLLLLYPLLLLMSIIAFFKWYRYAKN